MSLLTTIEGDLKQAMLARNELARETLRMVLAGIKNRRIEIGRDLEDEEVLAVLNKAVKSRQDSAQQYDDAGRPELAEKERAEVIVIEKYLPQQLSEDETRTIVKTLIGELGISSKTEMGQLMKALMARHRGEVDGKLAQQIGSQLLG